MGKNEICFHVFGFQRSRKKGQHNWEYEREYKKGWICCNAQEHKSSV